MNLSLCLLSITSIIYVLAIMGSLNAGRGKRVHKSHIAFFIIDKISFKQ